MSLDKNIKICDKIEELSRELKDNLFEIIILEKSTHPGSENEIEHLERKNTVLFKKIKENLKNLKLKN